MKELNWQILQTVNFLSEHKEIIIEFLRATPAWIALIISLITPILNKKLEIEKNKINFLCSKRFDVFENNFRRLYEFRNKVINFVAILLKHYDNEEYTQINDINEAKENLDQAWDEIRVNESSLWLVADLEHLKLKEPVLDATRKLFQQINKLSQNGVLRLNKENLEELIYLAKALQDAIGKIIEAYRKTFSVENSSREKKTLLKRFFNKS